MQSSRTAFSAAAVPTLRSTLGLAAQWELSCCRNPRVSARTTKYPAEARSAVSLEAVASAFSSVQQWPDYRPTRLTSLDWLASACSVAQVLAKDESDRCGLTSFKALGGGLVVDDVVKEALSQGRAAAEVTVATASAGNHGMGVAWGARRAGCSAVIYLGDGVSEQPADRMRDLGATVQRVKGSYEDALKAARADADSRGWHLVQDVSWEGYESVPARIHAGYGIVAKELLEQSSEAAPTHVLVNSGVGGFASAICGYLWEELGAARPRFICVEPTAAACLQHAAKTQSMALGPAAPGTSTVQTGLDCREVSPLAWKVLQGGADAFVAVPDDSIGPTMRLLAEGNEPIVAGESAVAGVAALLASVSQPDVREVLELNEESRVAVIICEAPPSPESYEALVGLLPHQVGRS